MMAYPSLRRKGPRYPWRPKINTNINPATMGDTANGKSIRAVSKVRPGKSKREIAHAVVRPKMTFAANAMGTTVSVKMIECRVSGSASRFFQYTPGPSLNATAKTWMTGMTTNTPTTARAKRVRLHRSHTGSCWALRTMAGVAVLGFSETVSVFMTHTPPFDHVDQHQHPERKDEQDHRNCGGFAVGKLLETRNDQDRSNLRVIRLVSGYEND